jgi:putative MATE family efflux protein
MSAPNVKENKMGTMPINKLIVSMSLPPLTSMFFQFSYNFVDSAFVAQLGEDALTAVSLSFPITTLMLACSIWVGVGAQVLISRHLGNQDQQSANDVASAGLLFSALLGIVLNILGLLIIGPYFRHFTDDETLYQLCMTYMGICAFMQVPNMVHIQIQKIIQATGNMLAPMWFQIAGVVFNFIFDPLLIFGIGPFPEMGIAGAAISTVGGYTLSMILAFFVLFGTKQKVQVRRVFFSHKLNSQIMKAGLPSFIMNALGAFMVLFTNQFLILCSTTAVAFFGAYFKIQQLIVMTVNGLIQGCLPIMSYNYGAKKFDRLREAFRKGTFIATFLMTVSSVALFLIPKPILSLFDATSELNAIGVPAMKIMAFGFAFNALSTMMATCLQAMNHIRYSLLINLMRQLLVLLPAMFLLFQFFGQTGVWLAFPVCEFITFLVALFLFRRQKFQ